MPAPPHQRAFMLRATAKVWRLAARTFTAPPDAAFYRSLQGLAQAPALTAKGLSPLEPDLQARSPSEAIAVLASEYAALFDGPQALCPPHAAAYGVDACYHFHMLRGERPDHVCTVFEVLAELYETSAGRPDDQLTARDAARVAAELLRLYASRWIPAFLSAVAQHANRSLYRSVAAIASDVITAPATLTLLHHPTTENHMLTIYSNPTCGFCHRLKSQLDRESIAYTDINIEEDPAAASYVESVNGGNQIVPTVVCGNGTVMTNPTLAEVKECLQAVTA